MPNSAFLELLKKDAIRETDSELKEDLSSIFAAEFKDISPLILTKSIELPQNSIKNTNFGDFKVDVELRNLKTPNLGK